MGSFAYLLSCENWSEMFNSLMFLRENYVSFHRKPFDFHFTDLTSFSHKRRFPSFLGVAGLFFC